MGEELFSTTCSACHTTGAERLIGPGLQDIESRRDREWLVSFITEPDRVIGEGDTIANRLLAEYMVPMPNIGTTRAQAESVLDYLAGADGALTGSTSGAAAQQAPATQEQVLLGQALFQGDVRLADGGPTCNSCHEVTNDAVIGGGILARELTTVFSRLGGPGVRAIIGSPPFPVMQQAYRDKPLTEEEVGALVAFLEEADAEQALHQPRDYGIKLFGVGVVGAVILLGIYSMIWRERKSGSVNQAIFDRQTRST
jgi:mono/diheme cytochrome c family protein